MRSLYLSSLIICIAKWSNCQDTKFDERSAQILSDIFSTYDAKTRPCGPGSSSDRCTAVEIRANMKILGILTVDDEKRFFDMQFLFRQEWNDPRLHHKYETDLTFDPNERSYRIWTPDTFFLQEKDGFKPLTDQPNNQFIITHNGTVIFSTRLSLTLSCPMEFSRYPFDEQSCELQFGSYAHPKEQVYYNWDGTRGVEVAPGVRPTTPFFSLGQIVKRTDCTHAWMTGTFSCLKADVHFHRRVGFAEIMKNFVPSFVLVLLSWLAFYLGSESIGIRALLGAGCLQFLLIHYTILSIDLPHVAGYRAIDIWFISCIIFVLLSLLQLLIVIRSPSKRSSSSDIEMVTLDRILDEGTQAPKAPRTTQRLTSESEPVRRLSIVKPIRKYTRLVPKDSARGIATPPLVKESAMVPTSQYYEEPIGAPRRATMMEKFRRLSSREKVDVVSRFLFPVLFFLFTLAYWAYYQG